VRDWSCTLEVVTPLFLAGADQTRAELRPASIRGALRFWFRAMMGGLLQGNWEQVKDQMRKLEAAVFGDTEQASHVQIHVVPQKQNIISPGGPPVRIKPGVVYLGFPFYQWAGQGQYRLVRAYFNPRSSFRLDFSSRPGSDSELLKKVIWGTLWLMTHMGGLGSRSRRGFGSLQAISDPEGVELKLQPPANPSKMRSHFQENLRWIETTFQTFATSQGIPCAGSIFGTPSRLRPPFSSFAKWRVALVTKDTWVDWQQVLDDLGSFIRGFRNKSADLRQPTPDYSQIVTHYLPVQQSGPGGQTQWVLQHGAISQWDLTNDAFGLPIQFRSSSRSQQATQQFQRSPGERFDISAILGWKLPDEKEDHDRRASPLIVRPLRLDNRYAVVLLLLESEFLPSGAVEWLKPTGKWPPPAQVPRPTPRQLPPADFSVLYSFLAQTRKTFTDLGELP